MPRVLEGCPPPEFISLHEATFALGANPRSFSQFLKRHSIEPVMIAGGQVIDRKGFYAAVDADILAGKAKLSRRLGAA